MASLPRRFVRSTLEQLGATSPGRRLVAASALAPPWMKVPLFERVASAMARHACDPGQLIETNLGVVSHLRVGIPARKPSLIFGTPDNQPAERATLDLARRLAPNVEGFLDIGAHEGVFTFAIACDRGPSVHAFEPDPRLFDRLHANVTRNAVAATLHRQAVGESVGRQRFHVNLDDDASGSLDGHFTSAHATVPVDVEVTTVVAYLAATRLASVGLKVDVEGAARHLWVGARPAAPAIDWMIVEMLEPDLVAQLPATIIRDTGWHAYYVRDFTLVPSRAGEFVYQHPFYNWLFTRHSPGSLARTLGPRFRIAGSGQ